MKTKQKARNIAKCCSKWIRYPALAFEVRETVDPVVEEEETEYIIEIENKGNSKDKDINLMCVFPAEMQPLPDAQNTYIKENTVYINTIPILEVDTKVIFRIRAKALKIGNQRIKFYLSSDYIKAPILEEENTYVY